MSVLVIIAVLAAKFPGPNWIVSPDWATSTALAIVAHGPLSRVQVASAPSVVTDTVAARAAAGNATSSASAASSPNGDRRQPRYGTNAANDERTTTTSTLGGRLDPNDQPAPSGHYAAPGERATPGRSVPHNCGCRVLG